MVTVTEIADWLVQYLFNYCLGHGIQRGAFFSSYLHFTQGAVELRAPDFLCFIHKGCNRRYCFERLPPRHEPGDLFVDNSGNLLYLLLPLLLVRAGNAFQVVYVMEVDILYALYPGVEVTGHSEVDKHQRAVRAQLHSF